MILPLEQYKKMIRTMPILCTDIVIKNNFNKYLLVNRKNEPLKSIFWVPGGRIMHFETIEDAINRIAQKEVNISTTNIKKRFIGVYQDFFNENSFESNTKYHTISIVYEIKILEFLNIKLDKQSESFIWSDSLPERFLNKIIN